MQKDIAYGDKAGQGLGQECTVVGRMMPLENPLMMNREHFFKVASVKLKMTSNVPPPSIESVS